jgi:hypothetical protein
MSAVLEKWANTGDLDLVIGQGPLHRELALTIRTWGVSV